MNTSESGFGALGLRSEILEAVNGLGYEEPTAIQREAIVPLLAGRDVLGQAATGTGKTAAFALPLLQRVAHVSGDDRAIRALVLVPTRELAMQVAQAIHKYGRVLGTSVLPIFGGQSYTQQLRALRRGVDVVVATPGRALDHLQRGTLALDRVSFLVLDEADEMLDMGFADELEAILQALPEERQTALFSATMAPRIKTIAKKHLRDPLYVTIASEAPAAGKAPRVREVVYVVQRAHKAAALGRVIDVESPSSAIVFCRTRTEVDELTETLAARGYAAEAIHGGLSQEQRDRVLRRFREGTSEILVATDVAARGLDIEHLSHVFNFDVPSSPDAYVHRIGRTGRAGREGVAITLAEPREQRLLHNIEHHTKRKVRIENIPTVHDLRERRIERTRASLEAALTDGGLERYRGMIETLASEYDVYDVAAAAVKLLDARDGDAERDEAEIPAVSLAPARALKAGTAKGPRTKPSERLSAADAEKLYIGLGRGAGIRPGDLVGAIANEAGIPSREIGAIEITDRFSLVEVPAAKIDAIIRAMKNTAIRGKKAQVRRDRGR